MASLRLRSAAALALVGLAACARPVRIEPLAGPEPGLRVERVALLPLVAAPQVERPGASVQGVEEGATEVIAARLVEALTVQGGIGCLAPSEVALWLERQGLSLESTESSKLGEELARAFGVDGVLIGRVRRYRSRVGGPHGVLQAAAVWFDLELRLPGGERVWAGTYHEEQKAVLEDLLSLGLAAERGFRWLDAPALADYGARALVASLAEERQRWR